MADFAPHNLTDYRRENFFVEESSSYPSSWQGFKAFDGAYAGNYTYWVSYAKPAWLSLDLGVGSYASLVSYSLRMNTMGEPSRAPKDWTVEGSNDNVSWDVLDTVTGETGWSDGEKRTFTCDVTGANYRYFKINVTANNGDSYIEIAEIELDGTAVIAPARMIEIDVENDLELNPYDTLVVEPPIPYNAGLLFELDVEEVCAFISATKTSILEIVPTSNSIGKELDVEDIVELLLSPSYNQIPSVITNAGNMDEIYIGGRTPSLGDTLRIIEVVEDPIEAAFSANVVGGVSPLTVNFTDLSSNLPTEWRWEFGDGAISTLQNPSHTYSSSGRYSVSLFVRNDVSEDWEIKELYIMVLSTGKMMFIAVNGQSIEVTLPGYGYEVECHMPITTAELHPSGYAQFDADSTGALDYRVLSAAKWTLPNAQKVALNAFFRTASLGRAETVTLRLGATPTGFFPFGPDYGDVGDFTVSLVGRQQGGQLHAPWKYWQDDLSFVLVTAPAYSPAAGTAQGQLSIGTVTGLLYPQDGFRPESRYSYRTDLSRSGVPHHIDGRDASDSWDTAFDLLCNTGNAAALVTFLTGATGRTTGINIYTPDDNYPYGADHIGGGYYTSTFLGSERSKNEIVLKMRHDAYNRWTIPLAWNLKYGKAVAAMIQDTYDTGDTMQDTYDTGDEIQSVY